MASDGGSSSESGGSGHERSDGRGDSDPPEQRPRPKQRRPVPAKHSKQSAGQAENSSDNVSATASRIARKRKALSEEDEKRDFSTDLLKPKPSGAPFLSALRLNEN